ncbi:MAG: YitT family protein [Clostridia bacterium]|nr:YitT family protein [Clostridia bacterium]
MTKLKGNAKEFLIDALVFIAASTAFSVGINCFLARNNILNGGFTGIATILNYLFEIPIGTAIFIMNVPLLLIAFKKLGIKFIFRTFLVIAISSIIIDIGAFLPVYRNDLLLSSIFGGLLSGISLGIIFMRNATTGGVDIIAKLIKIKYPHISLGKSIFILDAVVIIAGGFVYGNFESMLYASVAIFVSAQVLDYIIYGISRGAMIMIISDKNEEIRNMIVHELDRGVTVLKGQGGYSGQDKNVLLCACYDNQAHKLIKKIKSTDENAFFIVTQSKQILGNGFRNNI